MKKLKIGLKILVCDRENDCLKTLIPELNRGKFVKKVNYIPSIEDAQHTLQQDLHNVVFLDPLTLGVNSTSKFVFKVRELKEMAHILFVLYTDLGKAENDPHFYSGKRERFRHYYNLNKLLPESLLKEELETLLYTCRIDLRWRLSEYNKERFKGYDDGTLLDHLRSVRNAVDMLYAVSPIDVEKNTVFLSYSFSKEQKLDSVKRMLSEYGFKVLTGKRARGSVSESILNRIKKCEYFLSIMTRDKEMKGSEFCPSPWLLEEKGAAIAYGRKIILMVEEGVTGFGGLQGDWQRIHFTWDGFTNALLDALAQLKAQT